MLTTNDVWERTAPQASRRLSDEHRTWLREGSAIDDDVIDARGYYTLDRPTVATLVALEVVNAVALKAEAWLGIPITRPDKVKHGEIIRIFGGESKQKYLWPTGERNAFDVHPYCWDVVQDVTVPVILTEGIKKADAILSAAEREDFLCCVIAVNGNWGWHAKIDGSPVATPDFLDVAWTDRKVYIIPDSDFRTNDSVRQGWTELTTYVASKTGANRAALVVVPPAGLAKQGADDYLATGASLASLLEHAQSPGYARLDPSRSDTPLELKSGLRLIREAGTQIPHIYAPLVPERSVVLVAGHSGTFKTWACLALGLDAAFGLPWCDHPNLVMGSSPVTTLYVNKEMSGLILGQRLKTLSRAKRYSSTPNWEQIVDERLHIIDEAVLDLNDERQRDRLENAIVLAGAKIVVLDSLSMSWHGDENSSSEVGILYSDMRGISEQTGVTWVVLHHLTKPPSGRKNREAVQFQVRGSGQLYQQADACLFLSHYVTDSMLEGERKLVFTHLKARTSVEMPAWIVRFSDNDGLWTDLLYESDLSDARASAYAKSHGDPTKLGRWMRGAMGEMPFLRAAGPGLRTGQLLALLQAAWTIEDQPVPSDQTMRRQIKDMVRDGMLEVVEVNKRLGDLYRLPPDEDDVDELPSPVIT